MIIESKYNLGDRVWWISESHGAATRTISCPVCTDGTITHAGEKWKCPACNGTKGRTIQITLWVVGGSFSIGRIDICVEINDGFDDDKSNAPRYMENPLGGTMHNELTLFSDRDAAQAECDRRNEGRTGVVR